jgi:hypothetical protein
MRHSPSRTQIQVMTMGALSMVKSFMTRETDPDTIATQIADTKAVVANHRAEAERLTVAWRDADTAEDADKIERRRRECLRLAERGEAALPGMEAALVAARATKQSVALARHQSAARAMYPRLRQAVENAASVQAEAIKLREDAERELGGGVVQQHIPIIGFRGLLLPDLVAMWRNEMDRTFAEPAPVAAVSVVAPRVATPPARAVGIKDQRVVEKPVAPVAPVKPRREPRQDKVAPNGRLVTLMRSGVELPDGTQGVVGDVVAMLATDAERLVMSGAGDYFTSAS